MSVTEISANDLGRTFNCKAPNCDAEVNTNKVLGAYCVQHRASRSSTSANGAGDSLTERLNACKDLAKTADAAEAKAAKLRAKVKELEKAAQEAREDFAARLHELTQSGGTKL